MKYLLTLMLLTIPAFAEDTSKNMEEVQRIHRLAKDNPNSYMCYKILEPEDLTGQYCVFYKGPLKKENK